MAEQDDSARTGPDGVPRERSAPERTCVGCRRRAPAAGLLRVVARGNELVPDPGRRLPGRGASVHADEECLSLAERRRAFPRALRVPGQLDPSAVREHVRTSLASTDAVHQTTRQAENP